MNTNTCKTCLKEQPIFEFYKSTRTTSGYRNTCKKCCANKAAKRYQKTKEFVGHNQRNLQLPSQEWLQENFEYHKDGYFIRKITRGSSKEGSKVTGKLEDNGYYRVNINYSAMLVHRLIWKWHHGTEPEFLDHKNKIRTDNRIENLRIATKNENARNQVVPSNNTSGFIGVRWHEYYGCAGAWKAMISVNNQKFSKSFGMNLTAAVNWYNKMAEKHHGIFAVDKIKHNKKALEEYLSK